jgi:Bacterial Ig-like domain
MLNKKIAMVCLFAISSILTACGGGGGGSSDNSITVSTVKPTNLSTNLDVRNVKIEATFSRSVNPTVFANQNAKIGSLITASGFTVQDLATQATVASEGLTLGQLLSGKYYLARAGAPTVVILIQDYSFRWEGTGYGLELELSDSSLVYYNSTQLTSVGLLSTQSQFTITDTLGQVVPAEVTVSGATVTYTVLGFLNWGTKYTATIKAGVTELNGTRKLSKDFTWTFNTAPLPTPAVENVSPIGIEANPLLNITALTNYIVDPTTLENNVKLERITTDNTGATVATAVGAAVSIDNATKKIVINPTLDLEYLANYKVTIVGGVSGVSGKLGGQFVNLASDYSWTFSTAAAKVQSVSPSVTNADSPEVKIEDEVYITFNYRPRSNAITQYINIKKDGNTTVAYDFRIVNESTVVLTPKDFAGSFFDYGTKYTVNVLKDLPSKDSATTKQSADYSFSFTTENRKIIARSPIATEQNADINTNITVDFNFDVNASALNNTSNFKVEKSLTLTGTYTAVAGVITYSASNRRLTFNPNAAFDYNTYVRVTVGNSLPSDAGPTIETGETWGFRVLNQRFEVAATSPINNASDVSVVKTIEVRMNYPIDTATIDSSALTVKDCNYSTVSGRVSWDTDRIFFTPNGNYKSFCEHTVTLDRGVSGVQNRLQESNYSFKFKTDGLKVTNVYVTFAYGEYVDIDSEIEVVFNKDIACCSTSDTVTVYDELGSRVSGYTYRTGNKLQFVPTSALKYGMGYDVYVEGNASDYDSIEGINGETMASDYSTSFLTENLPLDVIDYGPTGIVYVDDEFWVETNYSTSTFGYPDFTGRVYSSSYGSVSTSTTSSGYDIYVTPYSDLSYDRDYTIEVSFDYDFGGFYDDTYFDWDVTTESDPYYSTLATTGSRVQAQSASLQSADTTSAAASTAKASRKGQGRASKADRSLRGCRKNMTCVGRLKALGREGEMANIAAKKRGEITEQTLKASQLKASVENKKKAQSRKTLRKDDSAAK